MTAQSTPPRPPDLPAKAPVATKAEKAVNAALAVLKDAIKAVA